MAYNRKLLYTKSFPSWNTPEGNLGSVANDQVMTPIQLVATEVNEPGSTITYAVTTGSLPTGLTLSSSGEISGTATGYTANETVNFTITATDDEGETASRDFSLQVLAEYEIDYLIIAGGGAGSKAHATNTVGGGGAGGYLNSYSSELSGGNSTSLNAIVNLSGIQYSIIVGAGGTCPTVTGNQQGTSGNNSSFYNLTAIGGGAGGITDGLSGGSGGGAGSWDTVTVAQDGGSGTANQGFSGGSSNGVEGIAAAGGGGAGQAGESGAQNNSPIGASGGNGLVSSITGTAVTRAGGGASSGWADSAGGTGGSGGGGNGGSTAVNGQDGANFTGSGGGGAKGNLLAGNGGSGVVILRMPTINYSGTTTGSPTVTTDGSDTILTYTGSGTYTT